MIKEKIGVANEEGAKQIFRDSSRIAYNIPMYLRIM